MESGIELPDTQTGFRLYPLEPLKKIKLFTNKFETEIEVIVKLAWERSEYYSGECESALRYGRTCKSFQAVQRFYTNHHSTDLLGNTYTDLLPAQAAVKKKHL